MFGIYLDIDMIWPGAKRKWLRFVSLMIFFFGNNIYGNAFTPANGTNGLKFISEQHHSTCFKDKPMAKNPKTLQSIWISSLITWRWALELCWIYLAVLHVLYSTKLGSQSLIHKISLTKLQVYRSIQLVVYSYMHRMTKRVFVSL